MNKFVILPWDYSRVDIVGPFSLALGPVAFTSVIPMKAIPLIRTTIEALRRLADAPRLTLTLDFKDIPHINPEGHPVEAQDRMFVRATTPIMDALAQWKYLKAFFAHICLSSVWWDGEVEQRVRWEKNFEATVMGEDYRSDEKIKQAILGRYEVPYS
ncbi:uncharacterized protein N7459_008136 [Penicillium hispanicum]|uniref:uncharacterized protein n=1 Tax=Penicillium hispanicum TaxID=1080232 RepID=UPI00254181EA|nr:uncharacterized protein N7459_008136 [Penicillium hispanicum]KAJ5573709.1 hypothetical protein N7459_008136 [Penicillium hispanicum]